MVVQDICSKIDIGKIQAIYDSTGISTKAYRLLFKPFYDALNSLGTKSFIVPRPYYVHKVRAVRNNSVNEVFGCMHSILSSPPIAPEDSSKGKKGSKSIIGLNERNNLWLDLEGLLRFMVIYYNLQEIDVGGQLEVCIKLDEMELSHAKKYERVSLTLMNKALLSSYEVQGKLKKKKKDPKWFSVQSEDHTWWLGLFQVQKENHDVLKWVFQQTSIPALIHKYHSGEKLIVEGFGAFMINFHMASDLKTEKCMYNISNTGAKTSKNCIYCNYTLKSTKKGHSKSTLDCDQLAAPDRHINDKTFQPILPIPLEEVHVCTLHALVRIVDKMIHHSACFVWNIRNEEERKEGIKQVEDVLSEAGLHGGCVKLEKDTKKSTGRSSIPAKVSLGDDKARHFLSKVDCAQRGDFEFGKKLVYAEHDRTEATAKKLNAWNALSDLNMLLQKHYFTECNKEEFRAAVKDFTTAYIQAWGESEVTHYVHIIYAHGPWFAEKYRSLAIWNTQGMEKSHKQAKVAFNKKTQRGGSSKSSLSNPLVQMTQWFYRRIIARHEENMVRRASPNVLDATIEAAKKRRRETWKISKANDRCIEWREKRQRVGSKFSL